MPKITPLFHLLRRIMRSVIAGEGAYLRLFAGLAGVNCVPGSFGLVLSLLESIKSPELLAPALSGSELRPESAVRRSTERGFGGSEGIPAA